MFPQIAKTGNLEGFGGKFINILKKVKKKYYIQDPGLRPLQISVHDLYSYGKRPIKLRSKTDKVKVKD